MLELNKVHLWDCLETIKKLEDNSIDAIVTDPPYELWFMGKSWDNTGIANNVELRKECLRVLKPWWHLLAFSWTRTYHRMACAIEDAGFEIRDMLEWIYASGFPKSQNIEKMMEKKWLDWTEYKGLWTATKPAHEPIIMARKPLSEKTIVENVLKHGTGAIDIDGCRIPTSDTYSYPNGAGENSFSVGEEPDGKRTEPVESNSLGRFPANILCTDDALNDWEITKSVQGKNVKRQEIPNIAMSGKNYARFNAVEGHSDSGSKSRYFDIDVWAEKHWLLQFPKASKNERNKGCEGLEANKYSTNIIPKEGSIAKYGYEEAKRIMEEKCVNQNHHPTVKPLHLMSWLIRLISKPWDIVLEPFAWSWTTCVACKMLWRNFIGCELTEEYIPICEARINAVEVIEGNKKEEEWPREIILSS